MAARRWSGDSQDRADLLVRQVCSIAQVDRQTLPLWQALNRLPDGHPISRIDARAPLRLRAEPIGQEAHTATPAMKIHRQPVERAERPRVQSFDGGAVAERCPEADQRLLDGVIGLVRGEAEVAGKAPQLAAAVRLQADDAGAE